MKVKELIRYEDKSKIKAGDATLNGKYPFFTSSESEDKRYDQYTCDAEGIIMGTGGNATLHYYNGKFAVSTDCLVLKTNQNVKCKYLYYFFKANMKVLQDGFKGAGLKHTNKNYIENIELNMLPNINEQLVIIERLDKINNIIQKHKKVMSSLDILIKARFVEMFGDVNVSKKYTLQNLIEKKYILYHLDGNHGSDYPRNGEFVEKGVPYIGANCIINGEIKLDNCKYVTEERSNKFRKGIAINEDVLFANNATVGPTAILHTNYEKVILSTSLTAFRCNKKVINPYYLKEYMLSKDFIMQYKNDMKQTTRNQVPITMQRKYTFLIPNIQDQNNFATFVHHIDKLKVA